MSGFEIAGIVLGSIPLLISAIENYESSLDRATAFFKWKDGLGAALREFWYQHSSFKMTLRNILKDVASPIEIEEMISDPQHELWKSPDLSRSLKSMLGPGYRPYISTIQDMQSCMKRLAGHLNLERQAGTADELEAIIIANNATPSPQGRPTFEFRRAIKLTMKRKGIQTLLQDMKVCNDRLDDFIAKSEKINNHLAIDSISPKPGLITSLEKIQSYATMLHQALSKAWSCSTHNSHDIRLLLEDRIERQHKQKSLRRTKLSTKPPCFTISHRPCSDLFPWQSAKIEIIDSSQVESHIPTAVRFQGLPTQSSQETHGFPGRQSVRVVRNLCTTFHRHSSPIPNCGLRLDGNGLLYGTYEIDSNPLCCAESFVSLEDLFNSSNMKWKPLTDEDRYRLAITLTSSFLQLHSTPWLRDQWNRHEILFSSKEIAGQLAIDIQHPFITERYQCTRDSSSTESKSSLPTFTDSSANLLILAKLLLKIKFHGRTQSPYGEDDLAQTREFDQVGDFQALNQWITQEKGNLSFAHYDAIQFCIMSSNNIDADLWDLRFRQVMLDKVVVPLVDELNYWRGVA